MGEKRPANTAGTACRLYVGSEAYVEQKCASRPPCDIEMGEQRENGAPASAGSFSPVCSHRTPSQPDEAGAPSVKTTKYFVDFYEYLRTAISPRVPRGDEQHRRTRSAQDHR